MKFLVPFITVASLQFVLSTPVLASQRTDDGREAYEAKCASCHDIGKNGAPRVNSPEDWKNRSMLWEAVLLEHAENGFLDMPPKGGHPQMPDYNVGVAAEYMLDKAHPEMPRD